MLSPALPGRSCRFLLLPAQADELPATRAANTWAGPARYWGRVTAAQSERERAAVPPRYVRSRWGEAINVLGEIASSSSSFLSNVASSPALLASSSELILVYRNCFSLFCFFLFPPGKRHRPEPTSSPCSVPLFYSEQWWWWSGGMDIALFPCISTPRGILLFTAHAFFLLIFLNALPAVLIAA